MPTPTVPHMKQLTITLLFLLAITTGAASAAPTWHGGLQRVAEKSTRISLEQAVEQVRRQTGGRILSAETVTRDGQQVHRIKVLTPDNRVVIREINADGH